MNKILLIGCGHMGSALLSAWYKKTSNYFSVVDPNKHITLRKTYKRKVSVFKSIDEIQNIQQFDIIIFAVKPQIATKVMKKFIRLKYNKNVLFISIIAGKKISFFNNFLPSKNQFVRIMPNMPSLVEEGMSCLIANKNTSIQNKNIITTLFNKIGKTYWLSNEKKLDKVTAISGSGPGYFFLFIDLLEKAAIKLGFTQKIAKALVYQTAFGSMKLLINNFKSAEKLTNEIAVKGGTTEAAIRIFKKNNQLKNMIDKAVKAAHKRAIELGKK